MTPRTRLEADLRKLVARQREQRLAAGVAAEARHLLDESVDFRFTQMACDHPEACSCPEDYPGWTPGGVQ